MRYIVNYRKFKYLNFFYKFIGLINITSILYIDSIIDSNYFALFLYDLFYLFFSNYLIKFINPARALLLDSLDMIYQISLLGQSTIFLFHDYQIFQYYLDILIKSILSYIFDQIFLVRFDFLVRFLLVYLACKIYFLARIYLAKSILLNLSNQ